MLKDASVRTLLSSPIPWLIGVFVLMAAAAAVWMAGSVVVIDRTDGVKNAVVTNDSGVEQKLHHLWNGYFYAIPNFEGIIEVRCGSGLRKQAGYVTGGLHTTVHVIGKQPCEKVTDAE